MGEVVEEAAPPTTGDHPSSCCCSGGSANKRRSSPEEDDQLVKKSKKQLFPHEGFNSPASNPPPLSPASTSRPSTSSNPPSFSPASTSRPPRPPSALRRTISDPSPYSQVFKKLRDGVKEMSSCLDQSLLLSDTPETVSQEEQSQVISQTDAPNALVPYHQDGEDLEANHSDESVSVEKMGDILNIQFRCPCGKSYNFMLSQGSCFYKLM